MNKKIISIFLILSMLICMVPGAAFGDEGDLPADIGSEETVDPASGDDYSIPDDLPGETDDGPADAEVEDEIPAEEESEAILEDKVTDESAMELAEDPESEDEEEPAEEEPEDEEPEVFTESIVYINPIYADVVSEDEITVPEAPELPHIPDESKPTEYSFGTASYNGNIYYTTVDEAADEAREYFKSRSETFKVYYTVPKSGDVTEYTYLIMNGAMEHTGVPTEGDYLSYQYGGWGCSMSYSSTGSYYYVALSVNAQYYTSASQEAEMNAAVANVLASLNLDGKSEYQKAQAIYDYICSNVTYDYTNLNDSSYKLKFTAYAALINKTAVCQGYSVLFYRLALEEGLDARVITGSSMCHAWNIVCPDSYEGNYYYLDSTWDCNYDSSHYKYWLKGTDYWLSSHKSGGVSEIGTLRPYYNQKSNGSYSEYTVTDLYNIPAENCTHIHTVITRPAKDPTCTEDGLTEGSYCSGCGKVFKEQTTVAALGHDYVDGVCSRCGDVKYAETVTITNTSLDVIIGDSVTLTASVLPANAKQTVVWSIVSGGEYATLDGDTLTGTAAGTVTVRATATAADGTEVYAEKEFTVVHYYLTVTTPAEYLMAGKTLKLTGEYNPYNITGTSIVWSLAEGDETYASVSSSGVVTAKSVTERHEITVIASAKDEKAEPAECKLTIYPYASEVAIYEGENEVTGSTITVDTSTSGELTFSADTLPGDTYPAPVTWKTSDTTNLYGEYTLNDDGSYTVSGLTLPANKTSATVTLTATAADGSGKSGAVKLTLKRYPSSVTISTAPTALVGGKSATLKASIPAGTYSDKSITWSLADEDLAYASISSSGALKTYAVSEPVTITATAVVKGNGIESDPVEIELLPAAAKAEITSAVAEDQEITITSGTTFSESATIKLSAEVSPAGASQSGTWKSSSTSIATVSSDGTVTFKKAGTVTITFKSTENSKVTATVKITYGVPAGTITMPETAEITSGGKATIKAAIENSNATVKTITYTSSDTSVATVSSSGVVTAKTVYEQKQVTITASANDGSGSTATCVVTINPKSNVVGIYNDGSIVNAAKLTLPIGGATQLSSSVEGVVWSSSKPSVAIVDKATGEVTVLAKGTAVITAKQMNGSKTVASGSVTINALTPVEGISLATKTGLAPEVVSGKSLALTAAVTNSNATNKSVSWSSSNTSVATVNSSGTVSAKSGITSPTTVKITATAKDGYGAANSIEVTVLPAATLVAIFSDDGKNISGTTNKQNLADGDTISLSAKVYPAAATDNVTWKSSNAKIATVTNGEVKLTGTATGTVTITATAADGSGKSSNVKLTVVNTIKEISFASSELSLKAGSKVTLTPTLTAGSSSTKLSSSALTWSITDGRSYATVSTSGVVTAKKVTGTHTVTVRATAKDNPSVYGEATITVNP